MRTESNVCPCSNGVAARNAKDSFCGRVRESSSPFPIPPSPFPFVPRNPLLLFFSSLLSDRGAIRSMAKGRVVLNNVALFSPFSPTPSVSLEACCYAMDLGYGAFHSPLATVGLRKYGNTKIDGFISEIFHR